MEDAIMTTLGIQYYATPSLKLLNLNVGIALVGNVSPVPSTIQETPHVWLIIRKCTADFNEA